MTGSAASIVQFIFILLIPLALVAAVLAGLFAIGALFNTLEHPEELRARIEGAFRRPLRPPRETASDHYYRAFWKSQ